MNLEDDILIDNYLRGNLTKGQVSDFEDRLKSDSEFKENFELEKALWQSLNQGEWSFVSKEREDINEYKELTKTEEFSKLKENLKKIDSEFKIDNRNKSNRLFYYLAAASVVLFLGFQFFFNTRISNQDLFKEYLDESDLPSFVSRDANSSDLAKAQGLFEDKNYEDALKIFSLNLSKERETASILIYKGLAEIELGEFDEAEHTFNVLVNSDLIDAEKGYWFKALSYLKNNEIEKAKIILNKIVNEAMYNNEKAKQLLEDLE